MGPIVTTVLALILGWNAIAIAIGLRGLVRRAERPKLAQLANRQAAAALGISLCFTVVGFAIRFPLLAAGEASRIGDMVAVIGWTFWAVGGMVPFTVTMLLRARGRMHGRSGAEEDV